MEVLENRNNYIISKALKHFLLASILTIMSQQLTVMVDGIIVSRLIGPDALSAITLYMPLNLIIISIITLLGTGAIILSTQAMGRRDYKAVDNILSTSVISIIIFGVIIGVGSWLLRDWVLQVVCHDHRLDADFQSYSSIMLIFAIIIMLKMLFEQMVASNGSPAITAKVTIIASVLNILLDILFIGVLNMGIAGAAWASIVSAAIGLIILSIYIFKGRSTLRLSFNLSKVYKYLGANIVQGIPPCLSNIVLMIMIYSMNTIVQNSLGADGLFVLSVCMNTLMLAMMFAMGYGNTAVAVGGFLRGEGDYSGVRILFNRCMMSIFVVTAVITLLLELFPSILSMIYGVDSPQLAAMLYRSFRIFVLVLTPYCLLLTLARLYQLIGYMILTPLLMLLFPLCLIPTMLLFNSCGGGDMLWYAFPTSGFAVFIIAIIISEIIRRRSLPVKLTPFMLLPLEQQGRIHHRSIRANREHMANSLGEIIHFLESSGLDEHFVNRVMNSIEEVMLNIVEHSGVKSNSKHYFDIRLVLKDNKLSVSLKDDGIPYDPTLVDDKDKKIGLKIITNFCSHIEYIYMYGLNSIFMSWEIDLDREEEKRVDRDK